MEAATKQRQQKKKPGIHPYPKTFKQHQFQRGYENISWKIAFLNSISNCDCAHSICIHRYWCKCFDVCIFYIIGLAENPRRKIKARKKKNDEGKGYSEQVNKPSLHITWKNFELKFTENAIEFIDANPIL